MKLKNYIYGVALGALSLTFASCYNADKEHATDAVYFIATIGDPDTSADSSYAIEVRINASGDISYNILQDRETLPVNNGMTIDPEG